MSDAVHVVCHCHELFSACDHVAGYSKAVQAKHSVTAAKGVVNTKLTLPATLHSNDLIDDARQIEIFMGNAFSIQGHKHVLTRLWRPRL